MPRKDLKEEPLWARNYLSCPTVMIRLLSSTPAIPWPSNIATSWLTWVRRSLHPEKAAGDPLAAVCFLHLPYGRFPEKEELPYHPLGWKWSPFLDHSSGSTWPRVDRCVPSAVADAVGEHLPGYPGLRCQRFCQRHDTSRCDGRWNGFFCLIK